MNHAIEINSLVKRYGPREALRGVSFHVPAGSITAFLGRNGAGKSTTLKSLLALLKPDSGDALVLGHSIRDERQTTAIRQRAAFVSERKDLYPYMTGAELLRFTRDFFPAWRHDEERRLVERFALPLDKKTCALSRGNLTKLNLLLALCRGADLLLLDEPTEGLDPAAIEEALQAIVSTAAAHGAAVLFSSHQLADVEQIADRVVLIDQGRIVLEDGLDELRARARRVQFVLPDTSHDADFARHGTLRREGRAVSVLALRDAGSLMQAAQQAGAEAIEARPAALKEIFLENTRNAQ